MIRLHNGWLWIPIRNHSDLNLFQSFHSRSLWPCGSELVCSCRLHSLLAKPHMQYMIEAIKMAGCRQEFASCHRIYSWLWKQASQSAYHNNPTTLNEESHSWTATGINFDRSTFWTRFSMRVNPRQAYTCSRINFCGCTGSISGAGSPRNMQLSWSQYGAFIDQDKTRSFPPS